MPSTFDAGAEGHPCRSCGEPRPLADLDQFHWCEECREELRGRITGRAHLIAALVVAPFAAWIVAAGHFGYFPFYAWLLPLAAAYYLGFRLGRELMKGWVRWKRVNERD